MAKFLDAARQAVSGAAPEGLNQQSEDSGAPGFLDQARDWYGGANREGTSNGYDTPFFKTFFEQQERAQRENRLGTFFDYQDATGIVTWDHTSARGSHRFGDVYENGQRVGNLYESYDKATADLMMADLTLDAQTKARAFQGGEATIAAEVDRKRATTEREADQWATQQKYQTEVEETAEEWQSGAGDDVATIVGGALGGTAVGAGIGTLFGGPVGTVIGGAIGFVTGGIGGWLNRDELTNQAARAKVQTDMATEQFGTAAGLSTGLQAWGGLGMKAFSPTSNLLHGVYDEVQGSAGDGLSEWYETDAEGQNTRHGSLTALDLGAGLVDAVGQFATGFGAAAFMTTMSSVVAGQVGQMGFTGGYTFDDRRGDFDNVFTDEQGNFDLGSAAAGIGKVGIDAIQIGMARGLTTKALDSLKITAAQRSGASMGGQSVTSSGFRYTLDDAGNAISRRPSVQMLAPSEAVQALSTRVLAMRQTARESGALTADDFYRASQTLASGERKWTAALVNGFGEGAEEAVQAVLEPVSHDQAIVGGDIWAASLQGFSMGAGMSLGAAGRGVNAEERQFSRAVMVQRELTGRELTREQWDRMSAPERANATAAPKALLEGMRAAAAKVVEEQRADVVAGTPAIEKWNEAVRARRDVEAGRLTDRTDGAFVITQTEDATVPNHVVASSLTTLRLNLQRHLDGLAIQRGLEGLEPQTAAEIDLALEQGRQIVDTVTEGEQRVEAAADLAERRVLLDQVNELLRESFEGGAGQVNLETGAPLTAEETLARARATTLVFVRDPQDQSGSYLALMPQANATLTEYRGHNTLQISHAVLQSIGGDYDGDKIRQQAQLVLDNDAFVNARIGMGFLGAMGAEGTSVNIATRDYEPYEVRLVAEAISAGGALANEAAGTLDRITSRIRARYADVVPPAELNRILESFATAVKAGDKNSRARLIDTLAADHANGITQLARQNLTNEWLWLDQVVQSELQRFQRAYANHRPSPGEVNRSYVAPSQQTKSYREVHQTKAASDGIELGLRAEGFTLFRMFQKLHYSVFGAPIAGSKTAGEQMPLGELRRFYEQLSQAMTRSAVEELDSKDEITGRVLAGVRGIAASGALDTAGRFNAASGMALLANTQVPNIDRNGNAHPGKVSLVQLLLRESLERDIAEKAAVLDVSPDLQAKHARLRELLKPGAAAAAFVEVFGQTQLYELVGEAAAALGSNLTVEQFVRTYTSLDEAARQDVKRALHGEPEYLGRERTENLPYGIDEASEGKVSGFRSLVDAMLETGNKRLAVTELGDAIGELGERSDRVHKDVVESFEMVEKAFGELVGFRNLSRMKAADIQALMKEQPEWAAGVMGLIPDAAANAVFEERTVNGRTELFVANWVFDMFKQPAEQAAMTYWRNLLIAQWNSKGVAENRAYEKLDRRMHRLMYRLAQEPDGGVRYARFLSDLAQAKSLPEFMRLVNTVYRAQEPAYTAWVDDASEFDADKAGGGWTSIVDGAAQREAIKELRQRSERLVSTLHEERLAYQTDTETMVEIGEGLRLIAEGEAAGQSVSELSASPAVRRALQLRDAVQFAKQHLSALGPAAMESASVASLLGFFSSATDKGKTPPELQAAGMFEGTDVPGYAHPWAILESSTTSVDLDALGANMSLLARDGLRTMDETGRPVNWDVLDERGIYELWMSNPAAAPAIRSILFPSVWEKTPNGKLSQRLLVGKSITELLDGDVYAGMFKPTHESRLTYDAMLQAVAKRHGGELELQRFVDEVLIAHSSSMSQTYTAAEAEQQVQRAYAETADLFRIIGELAAGGFLTTKPDGSQSSLFTEVRNELRKQLRDARVASLLGLDPKDADLSELAIRELLQDRKTQVLDEIALGNADAALEFKALETRVERLLVEDQYAAVVAAYSIPAGDPAAALEKKRELVDYVRSHMSMMTKAAWAMSEIARLTDSTTPVDTDGLPSMSDAEWDTISRAVIGTYLDDMTSVSAPGISTPVFPEAGKEDLLRLQDPSFTYLADRVLDPESPLVKAAADLHREARMTVDRADTKVLVDKLMSTVFHPERLGQWTSDIPRLTASAAERLNSSPVMQAISRSGLAPVREVTFSAATQETAVLPPADAISTLEISADRLLAGQTTGVQFTLGVPGAAPVEASMPLMQLNGRFANAAVLTYAGPDGQPVEVDLWAAREKVPGDPSAGTWPPALGRYHSTNALVRDSGFRAITVRQLRRALRDAMPPGVDPSRVTISLSFLHPDSQPADPEFYNSVFFEGVVHELDGHQTKSLNSELWFSPGGLSPNGQATALQANKKGKSALRINKPVSPAELSRMEDGWQSDLGAVLNRKALALMTRDAGTGRLVETFFNATHKRLKAQHFVRGFDADGVPVMWTAEQVISWQRANPDQDLPLEQAELWIPSWQVLRTMLGELGAQGITGVGGEVEVDPTLVPRYRGLTDEMLAKVPNALETETLPDGTVRFTHGDLFATDLIGQRPQSRLTVRPPLDDAQRTARERGMQMLDGRRQDIHVARRERMDDTQRQGMIQRALTEGQAGLKAGISVFDWRSAGFPFIAPRDPQGLVSSAALLNEIKTAVAMDGQRTAWVLDLESDLGPADGVYTAVTLDPSEPGHREPPLPYQLAPNDLMVMKLSGYGKRGQSHAEQLTRAKRHADRLMADGLIIVFGDDSGATDLSVELAAHLDASGYRRVAGSRHVYAPTRLDRRSQTVRARLSTLIETRGVSAESALMVFLADGGITTENAAYVTKPGARHEVAVTFDLVPTNAFSGFNVPVGKDQVAKVKAQIQGLLSDPVGRAHLHTLSGTKSGKGRGADTAKTELEAALHRMVETWNDDPENPGVTPRLGAKFGPGDIIPLFNERTGQILLYRHGYAAPSRGELAGQMATPLVPGGGAANVGIYSTDPLPSATTHEGTVVAFEPRSRYGLSVKMRVPLQSLGDKLQLENGGMKYVTTSLSSNVRLPEHGVFAGWGIDVISDAGAAFSKESFEGLVNNHRRAFAVFGVDFMPDMIKFLYGKDLNDRSLTTDQRTAMTRGVREVLHAFGRLPKQSVETIRDLVSGQYVASAVDEVLAGLGSLSGQLQLRPDWRKDLATEATPEAQIAKAMLFYMLSPQAQVEHVLSTGGFDDPQARSGGGVSKLMPQLFTEFFDNAPLGSALRQHINRKLNDKIANPAATTSRAGYVLSENFRFHVLADEAEYDMSGWLQFDQVYSAGDNPVLNEMAMDRSSSQKVSPHAAAISWQAIAARTAFGRKFTETKDFAAGTNVERWRSDGSLWNVLNAVPAEDTSFRPWRTLNPAEQYYKDLARDAVGAFRQPLSQDGWSDEQVNEYRAARNRIALAYGLREDQSEVVDYWVRQHLGQPLGEGDQGRIGQDGAMQVLSDIQWNAANGYLPTLGAEVPMLHYFDLNAIFRAGTFELKEEIDSASTVVDWDDWVKVSLGSSGFESDIFDPLYLLAVDGFMHSYVDASRSLVGLPVSVSVLKTQALLDPESSRLVLSIDPAKQVTLETPQLTDERTVTLADLMGGQRVAGKYLSTSAPAAIRAKRRAARVKWRKENGVPMPVPGNLRNFREHGAQFIDDGTKQNALFRILTNLRVGNALFNPALWVSAVGEIGMRAFLEDASNIITGTSTGAAGRVISGVTGGRGTIYTPGQLKSFRDLTQVLGQRTDFKGMIYRDLMFQQPRLQNAGRFERWSHNWARFGSRLQDPTYGMPGDVLARRYLETALQYMAAMPGARSLSPEQLVAHLRTDPTWLRENRPEVHDAATAVIANVRSLKPTPISLALRGVYEPLSENPNFAAAAFGTLVLKLPLMFSTYATNVATTMLGLQGPMTALAMVLHGRKNTLGGGLHSFLAGDGFRAGMDSHVDMSEVLEGIDLSKVMIQSGLTHTALMALGMAAGGLGLTGEDEEDRRRRRAAQMQGAGYVYDPRDLENDFRNADAIFLDWLPFGLGELFRVTEDESMANLHWMLRQFVSPVIGIERFLETGDTRQILWGYQDALASFPLINQGSWDDAVSTAAQLQSAAKDAESRGTPEDMSDAFGFLVTSVAVYERMLFENSFVNTVYVGLDKYDRDPFVIPERDAEGNLMRDRMDTPRPTQAMESYVDPVTGEVKEGYVSRDWADATLHQLTEKRATMALFMSLFTGFNESTYLRDNMVVKTRKIDKPEMDQATAEALVLSVFDAETGTENLTLAGAEGVVRGLWKGSVQMGSPALEGVYIPFEMRQQIQKRLMDEIVQEGVDLGLEEYQAKQRMRELWYGPSTDPTATGIGDILWSDQISYSNSFRYNQLNTTYVLGPDGRPWATGAQRTTLLGAFGLQPLEPFYQGQVGNLGVDGRLNSVDEAAVLNTGMRALERQDESWLVPTPEEIGEEIEKALTEALAKSYQPGAYDNDGNGWRNYGSGWRNFGRRGGGGGGGSFTRLNAPQDNSVPYANDIPFINTSNPIIRRSTIRRERFSSDRGRLKSWQ